MTHTALRSLTGLTADQYAALRAQVKALPFRVSLRQHREKYVAAFVSLRPLTREGWTEDQVEQVRGLVLAHGLSFRGDPATPPWFAHRYNGFGFLGVQS